MKLFLFVFRKKREADIGNILVKADAALLVVT